MSASSFDLSAFGFSLRKLTASTTSRGSFFRVPKRTWSTIFTDMDHAYGARTAPQILPFHRVTVASITLWRPPAWQLRFVFGLCSKCCILVAAFSVECKEMITTEIIHNLELSIVCAALSFVISYALDRQPIYEAAISGVRVLFFLVIASLAWGGLCTVLNVDGSFTGGLADL